MTEHYLNYVNGEWRDSADAIEIFEPATGKSLGTVPAMSHEDVDYVMNSAKKALPAWRALSYVERAAYLQKAADILYRDAEKIGSTLSKEIAKGLKSSIGEVTRTAEIVEYTAKVGVTLDGEVMEGGNFEAASKNKLAVVRREPVGLVLAISPFNYPVNLAGSKIAPALMGGNVVAFKPPTQGSISGLLLAKASPKLACQPASSTPLPAGVGLSATTSLNTRQSTSSTSPVPVLSARTSANWPGCGRLCWNLAARTRPSSWKTLTWT